MNPFEMVVLIVAIVVIGRVFSDRYRGRHRRGGEPVDPGETARLKSEIQQLKERIATLERLAVDKRQRLADEIDALGRD